MCSPESLRARLMLRPFLPFRVVTSSGQTYDVTHPDLVFVGARDFHVGIATKDDPSVYDRDARIYYMHVTSLDDLPVLPGASAPPTTNGPA